MPLPIVMTGAKTKSGKSTVKMFFLHKASSVIIFIPNISQQIFDFLAFGAVTQSLKDFMRTNIIFPLKLCHCSYT